MMTVTGGTPEPTDAVATFERERPHLLAVAFRILGADADAEDVVQEAWIRYSRSDLAQVRNITAWLTTVVARLCLDALRRRRELPQAPADEAAEPASGADDPEQLALLASELASAFTVVLEELTPPQRVALVLHDAFGTPFDEVAHVLGTTPDSAKKLASRARGRVRHRVDAPTSDAEEARRVVDAFLDAAQHGDTDHLIALLDPAVVRTADPQVLRPGARQRIRGVEAVVAEARLFQANAHRARLVSIDGQAGIAVFWGTAVQAALVFQVAGGRILRYDVIADPQRLGRLHIER
jgi:RNA polymerase sigma-70 factor (ECF subfamily)